MEYSSYSARGGRKMECTHFWHSRGSSFCTKVRVTSGEIEKPGCYSGPHFLYGSHASVAPNRFFAMLGFEGEYRGWHLSQRLACVASEPNGVERHRFMKALSWDKQLVGIAATTCGGPKQPNQ